MSRARQDQRADAPRRFKRYPAYKDSGVEWLGEVPVGWEVLSLKRVASIKYGLGEPPQLLAEGLPFIRATNVTRGRIVDRNLQFVDPDDVPWNREPALRAGDIIVVRSGAYTGDSAIIPAQYDGAIAGYDMVVRGRTCQPDFLAWTLLSRYVLEAQIELASLRAAQPHLNAEELGSVVLLRPSDSEQRAIATYLDRETARIDALVAKKQRLIELLLEQRTALITRAVTKGLDPKVPMKDSGVEWLGEIPVGWDVKRLKFILAAPLKYGANESADLDDPDLPRYVRITDIDESDGLRDETFKSLPVEIASEYMLREGDLLFARSGATAGKTFLYRSSWGECAYAGYLIRARIDTTRDCPEFIRYFTASSSYWLWLSSVFIQATIQNVSSERYASLRLPLPLLSEQRAIATHLDRETARIDALGAKVRNAITHLKELRTALISAAVTGKIDLREEVA
ncbi:MAG: restriction endonuclease subunit S [Ardenticatenia bacterium]|nr:restriction endonuclease subunit S [Ardenticatenia bacterium]